jgi:hypothetical protein
MRSSDAMRSDQGCDPNTDGALTTASAMREIPSG